MYHRAKDVSYVDNREIHTRQYDKIKFKVIHPLVKKAFKSPNYFGAHLWDRLPKDSKLSLPTICLNAR